ncbi:DUF6915 family protein [Rubrimonas cliftonensis]|uniref:Uncharacterized protein n=1 Tax=Rubrimonas cliftonensis TaxID=89524 RepID=A0A1H4ES93_9RHOB|nr:hypothetical protein [Rubrimonas cliftonensis]SEA87488.1 hypothetical protein SAMN05444370_11553 [Rubrimonas cliftonensis]
MAHALHHAESSARRFGGDPTAYMPIHEWLDATKIATADRRHRAGRHHAFGVFEAERVYGRAIDNGAGRMVPVRMIAEQHIREDLGRIPSLQDWVAEIPLKPWMMGGAIDQGTAVSAETDRSVERWRADVALGRTILGWLDWLEAEGGGVARPMLDASTGHLSPATRDALDALEDAEAPTTFLRGPFGWLVYVASEPGLRTWPEDLEAVLAYARERACDYVLFDRDGPVVDALAWFEDDAAAAAPAEVTP